MNKIKTIILAILGGCSVLIELMTPLAVAILWGWYFNLSGFLDILVLIIGGLATLFRGFRIGWMK